VFEDLYQFMGAGGNMLGAQISAEYWDTPILALFFVHLKTWTFIFFKINKPK